jgi:hypothetical protein
MIMHDHHHDHDERRREGGESKGCRFISVSLVSYRMYFFILFQTTLQRREHHAMDTPNDIDDRERPASSGQETGKLDSNELMVVVSRLPLDISEIEVNEELILDLTYIIVYSEFLVSSYMLLEFRGSFH